MTGRRAAWRSGRYEGRAVYTFPGESRGGVDMLDGRGEMDLDEVGPRGSVGLINQFLLTRRPAMA